MFRSYNLSTVYYFIDDFHHDAFNYSNSLSDHSAYCHWDTLHCHWETLHYGQRHAYSTTVP